ncbi:myosin light chain kinase, smooth muscle-like [Schistocerca serialis cubense]|uniref:myosin light chain kinase, smooth muscle-like n=1 Tax=Schistocerca serialis cubense TaxID=2023355 RepID=UPI00214EDBF0|nr:myosin light chain kinase, smooth muscle-like [Schistocerca serialis cubense]
MIKVDEEDPIGEVEPSFPYRDVQIRRGVDIRDLYDLQEEIGRGKFGTVYRCREKSTGLRLAAKMVSTPKREDRRNVEREVDVMRVLQHPRLIQLYDAFDNGKTMCVVLELIEGGELFERVIDDDFILTEKSCTVFMRQICEGMEFIHSKHILHLDMKPENILCLTKTGNRIKIIDFGLARKFDPTKKLQVLFGTPEFVAPEVVNFDQIGFGTDMWSIGVICYVLLSGLSPFMGDTDVETMANVTIAKYDFDDEAFNEISDDAKDFIEKLLVKDIEGRMSASQCLAHPWLKRKPPAPPPPPEELDLSKDNLRVFVERWNEHPNSPYLFDGCGQMIMPLASSSLQTVASHTSLGGLSPSPPGSLTSYSSYTSSLSSSPDSVLEQQQHQVALGQRRPSAPTVVGTPPSRVRHFEPAVPSQGRYHLERLQTFERRASEGCAVTARRDSGPQLPQVPAPGAVNLADEIRKLSDKLYEMASLLSPPSTLPPAADVANNNVPAPAELPPPPPFLQGPRQPADSPPAWRRQAGKHRVSNLNRDVPRALPDPLHNPPDLLQHLVVAEWRSDERTVVRRESSTAGTTTTSTSSSSTTTGSCATQRRQRPQFPVQ